VAQRSDDSRSTWQGFNVERTLTDLRGVDGFERFLSSKHFIRGPHGMFYCMRNRNEKASRLLRLGLARGRDGVITNLGRVMRMRKEGLGTVTVRSAQSLRNR